MENRYFLPTELCDKIFAHEFQLDIGNITEDRLTQTVQLYVEAISYYTALNAELSQQKDYDPTGIAKRTNFYQQKIKRLLVRSDVQQCLVGKKSNSKGLDFQKELAKVNLHAPQQARVLLQHYTSHLKQQQNLIQNSLARQRTDLAERIQRRSKSKRKNVKEIEIEQLDLVKQKLKVSPLLAYI